METRFSKWAALVLIQLMWVAGEEKSRSEVEKKILQDIFLGNKFHMYVRPDKDSNETSEGPLEISVSLYVIHVDVDTKNQECNVQMFFRQEWNDSRLSYDNQGKIKVLAIHDSVGFWTPDLFFVNEKSGHFHMLTKPNSFVRIYPSGKIHHSQRFSVTLSCLMDLRQFPFDSQVCTLPIESYGYSADDLMLKWKPEITFGINEPLGFHVFYSTSEQVIHMGENKYSRLELGIHVSRRVLAHLIHVFIPLSFMAASSWISFWLQPSSYISRLAISITSIITFLMVCQSLNESFAYQNYVTALDVWIGVSFFLTFAVFLENIYVIVSRQPQNDEVVNKNGIPELQRIEKDKCKLTDILAGKLSIRASNADLVARITFPSMYVLFNIIYFGYFLV